MSTIGVMYELFHYNETSRVINLYILMLECANMYVGSYNTLMGLIFARTNFRELENFAFREDLISRMSCFTIFREYLFSRIGYAENFREY